VEARDLSPLAGAAAGQIRGRETVLIQHEWNGLHWLRRRLTYLPALVLADVIVMFSPLVKRELADDAMMGWTARRALLAPLPPIIAAPAATADSGLRQKLATARAQGRLVIGISARSIRASSRTRCSRLAWC
jgi:hypothetical protein